MSSTPEPKEIPSTTATSVAHVSPTSTSAGKKSKVAPSRNAMPSFESFGLVPAEGVYELASDSEALALAYGAPSLSAFTSNGIVVGSAIAACFGGLLFGFDQGLVSIVLVMPKFIERFPEINSGFMKGLLTALLELGALIGSLIAGFSADKFSRKVTLGLGIFFFVVGSVIQTASFNYGTLVAGRTIGGIGIGILSSTAPTYISEVAPPSLRGALLVAEDIAIVFGIVVMFYITYGTRTITSEWCFRLPFLLQMVPAFILMGLLFWMPYSPRWMAQQGRDAEALEVLCRIRKLPRTDVRVQAEWLSIRSEACYCREVTVKNHPTLHGEGFWTAAKLEAASWVDCFRPGVARRSWVGIGLMFFQQFVGINALIYYAPTLFETLGFENDLQLQLSGIVNVVQLVGVCTALWSLDKIGRRPPVLFGSVMMTICHLIVAVMIGLFSSNWPAHPGQAKAGVAFINLFMFFYAVGWGPVPWALPSEIHSTSTRAKGVALSVATNWLCNFIIGLITPPLIQDTGFGTFVFFGAFSLLSGIFAFFFVPETKGKSLEDMDSVFHSNTAAIDAQEKSLILGKLTGNETARTLFDRQQDKRQNKGTERRFEYA